MSKDYIRGSKDRARKTPVISPDDSEYMRGYEEMHELLVPIEQEIVLATFKYKSVAEERIRELEEQFRDHGDAGHPAACAAEPAQPSE